jgi:hypothetical protein
VGEESSWAPRLSDLCGGMGDGVSLAGRRLNLGWGCALGSEVRVERSGKGWSLDDEDGMVGRAALGGGWPGHFAKEEKGVGRAASIQQLLEPAHLIESSLTPSCRLRSSPQE